MVLGWSPPEFGFVKVNVDGSCLGNPGKAGFGGVVRNHGGQWMTSFFLASIGVWTNLLVKLQYAIKQGLIWCWDQGWRNVCCESGSLEVVDLVIMQLLFNAISMLGSFLILDPYWGGIEQHLLIMF